MSPNENHPYRTPGEVITEVLADVIKMQLPKVHEMRPRESVFLSTPEWDRFQRELATVLPDGVEVRMFDEPLSFRLGLESAAKIGDRWIVLVRVHLTCMHSKESFYDAARQLVERTNRRTKEDPLLSPWAFRRKHGL